jgi:hypothetical protein
LKKVMGREMVGEGRRRRGEEEMKATKRILNSKFRIALKAVK